MTVTEKRVFYWQFHLFFAVFDVVFKKSVNLFCLNREDSCYE